MTDGRLKAPPVQDDGLQIAQKRGFQRMFWAAQRWAWIIFGLIILAALAGLTGRGGFFAQQSFALSTGKIEAPRFTRWHATDDLIIRFSQQRDSHAVLLGRSFLDSFQIERIQPQPRSTVLAGKNNHFEFAAAEGGGHTVIFRLRPVSPGIARYRAEVDGAGVNLSTIVLP